MEFDAKTREQKELSITGNLSFLLPAIFLLFTCCQEDTIDPLSKSSLTGTVLEGTTNQPLSNVSITTTPPSAAVLTNEEGVFEIENIEIGDHSIIAEKVGYDTETVNVAIDKELPTEVVIVLNPTGSTSDNFIIGTFPEDQATDQPISVQLSWGVDGTNDNLQYDVFLYESNSLQKQVVATDLADTTILVDGLKYATTYFWQVNIKKGNAVIQGEVRTFETGIASSSLFVFARESQGNIDVYSTDLLGNQFRLTHNPNRDWRPLVSPNRNTIAFASNREVQSHIYLMNLDGSQKFKVTTLPNEGFNNPGIGLCWAPDGGQILYSNYDKLYRVGIDGNGLALLSTAPANRHYRECDWTDQNDKIVVLTIGEQPFDSEIYIMDADGSNNTLVVPNQVGSLGYPTFSIDGSQIMFTRDVSGFESDDGRQLDARIFIMNMDGSNLIDVSSNKPTGTNDLQPRFSTTGGKIIFTNVPNDGLSAPEIWMMDVDGTNREKLVGNAMMPG